MAGRSAMQRAVVLAISEHDSLENFRNEVEPKLTQVMRESLIETKHLYRGSLFLSADIAICERLSSKLQQASK